MCPGEFGNRVCLHVTYGAEVPVGALFFAQAVYTYLLNGSATVTGGREKLRLGLCRLAYTADEFIVVHNVTNGRVRGMPDGMKRPLFRIVAASATWAPAPGIV